MESLRQQLDVSPCDVIMLLVHKLHLVARFVEHGSFGDVFRRKREAQVGTFESHVHRSGAADVVPLGAVAREGRRELIHPALQMNNNTISPQ